LRAAFHTTAGIEAQPALPSTAVATEPEPVTPAKKGAQWRGIDAAVLEIYDGNPPQDLSPAKLRRAIIDLQKRKAGKQQKPPDPS
jgi:hypothetical protein